MSSNYAYKTREHKFLLKEWLPTAEIFAYDKFKDYYNVDDIDTIIDHVDKMLKEVIAPTADDGENNPVYFENGKVYVPESFRQMFKYIQENGWGTSNIDEESEGTLPLTVLNVLNEMMVAANTSLSSYLVLTTGAAGLIQTYGDKHIKELFLPKMFDGTWSGTMCLTEPIAGSDVGEIISKTYPTDDPRIYKIKGSKIFITGGDGNHVDNVIHLYLARIDGAVPGTKGISLFVVPKYWVNDDGSLEPNDVEATAVEHKMGLKGSATVALAFGENNGCRGWLLGDYQAETGIGNGMSQMFQMMNEERITTGNMALALATNAYWNAAEYCKERIQGRPMTNPKADRTQIINHEDVKRMLLLNKATTEACRAIILKACYYMDIIHNDKDPERKKIAQGMFECLTPLAKAYPTDEAWNLICESIQAYGGYGYCEEYPVAQAARDCKVLSIWEGTNFIQSMDLVGRKWNMRQGTTFSAFLNTIEVFYDIYKNSTGLEKEFANLGKALDAYKDIMNTIASYMANNKVSMVPTFSRRILTATAQLYGGKCLLEQALIAQQRIEELGKEHHDYNFYHGKVLSARYYLRNTVPHVWLVAELVRDGDSSVVDALTETFDY
jgi:alkylation response protein AidB-like acyl-CoA dehydrogenase